MEGHNTVPSVIGPIGHSISDLKLSMKTILNKKPWESDPKVLELPWKTEDALLTNGEKKRSFIFGVMRSDGVVSPHPPVSRAMDRTIAALEAAGHEVIEWAPPAHSEAFQHMWNTFAADGGIDIHKALSDSGEPPVPELSVSYGEKVGTLPVSNINDLWALQTQIYDFQARYLAYWNSTAKTTKSGRVVDAVIMPVTPTASFRPTQGMYFGYTAIWNLLDYSVVTVPVTRVDREKDVLPETFEELGGLDRNVWNTYDPKTFHGAPVGVQVVARRLEEEKVLAIGEEVVQCLKRSKQ